SRGPEEVLELSADSTRIRADLGYRERLPQKEALRRTIKWERTHPPEPVDPTAFDYAAEDAALAELEQPHSKRRATSRTPGARRKREVPHPGASIEGARQRRGSLGRQPAAQGALRFRNGSRCPRRSPVDRFAAPSRPQAGRWPRSSPSRSR